MGVIRKIGKAYVAVVSPMPKKPKYRCDPQHGGCGSLITGGNLCMRCIKRKK